MCQVSSILDIEKIDKFHQLSQNEPKTQFWGANMGDFWPQNESEVSKTVLSSSALKVDEVCQVSSILDIKKNRENSINYHKMSQKRSFWGKNGPFSALK